MKVAKESPSKIAKNSGVFDIAGGKASGIDNLEYLQKLVKYKLL